MSTDCVSYKAKAGFDVREQSSGARELSLLALTWFPNSPLALGGGLKECRMPAPACNGAEGRKPPV